MKFLTSIDGLVLVDTTVLSERCEVVIVQNARYDTLGNDAMSTIVHNGGRKDVETLTIQDLEGSKS